MKDNSNFQSIALKRSSGPADRVYMAIVYMVSFGSLLLVGLPIVYILSASVSDPDILMQGKVFLWPIGFTLEAYEMVFHFPTIWRGYANSLYYTALGTTINLIVTVMAAFPLSRKGLMGRKYIMLFFTITMFFNGGLVPTYMVVMNLGLIDKVWAIVLPFAIGVWNLIIMRTFFQNTVPEELYEATVIDGGKDMTFLFRVLLPLSKPVIAVMVLMFAIARWNSYFPEMMYLNDTAKMPLQVILRQILTLNNVNSGLEGVTDVSLMMKARKNAVLMRYALIVVASVPVMIIYPFAQRHFLQGFMLGAVKG